MPKAFDHLYIRLAAEIRQEASQLLPHSKLPSIRYLSQTKGVNTSTVVAALRLLETEGFVYCKEGSGTYLAPVLPPQQTSQLISPTTHIDFTSGTPSPEYFPVTDFQTAFNTVLERDRGLAFAYPEPQGYLPLRISIADYLSTHGMVVDPAQVYITSGAQQAIYLLANTLLKAGDTVLAESPTYPGALGVFRSLGAKIISVPLGYYGPKRKPLEQALKSTPRLMYSVPNFQNPTGIIYSNESRVTLIDLARHHDFYIIEDDHISELHYACPRPRALWQDAPDRVLYVKSFSKVFMPGLRLGFMVVPTSLLNIIKQAKLTVDLGSSGINQRALDHYLRQGKWESHQDFLRNTYHNRAIALHSALERHAKHLVHFQPLRGGMNCWISLPSSVTGAEVQRQAFESGVLVSAGEQFTLEGTHRHHLRLSIAAVFEQEIEQGIELIAGCISRLVAKK